MSDYITTTNNLKITELDFDAIKRALTTYLQGQDEFKDYDFTGSAMNILLDVLAYNTHYNGFYTNMLASEMFMDSASLRSSVVSLAKHLGYTPSSRKGATVNLDITFESSASAVTIPKNFKFTTTVGTTSYTFLTTRAHSAQFNSINQNYQATSVEVKEGINLTASYTVQGTTNEIFDIPNENVDVSTLVVSVAGEYYYLADNYTEVTSNSRVFFLQEGDQNRYQIYFGDGAIGKKPSNGDTVTISYNISVLGSDGNGASVFFPSDTIIAGATNVQVSLSSGFTRASGGAERETTSSIRIQAPRQFGLQKRVVTANDYKTRLENDYNLVDAVRVWGGEENNPPHYGTVYICVKPKTGYVLSSAERTRIGQDIIKKRNVVTVKPVFVDPSYMFIVPDISVSYDPRKTSRTPDQLKALVKANIILYVSNNLTKFDQYFRYSALSRIIDDSEVGITNSNMNIAMKKRFKPINRVQGDFGISFDNPIHRPHSGHMRVIQSTIFKYRNIDRCMLIDKDGELLIVEAGSQTESLNPLARPLTNPTEYQSGGLNSYLQDYTIVERGAGRVDYSTGEMRLTNFAASSIADGSEYIYIHAKPRIQDVIPKRNTIITIEPDDINIKCIDDTLRIADDRVRSY